MNLYDYIDGGTELATDERPVLLPIQQDLLTRGRAAYVNGVRRVLWQAPCGAGKTIVAAEQTRLALEKDRTILHIVHRRRLVDQMQWTLQKFGIFASPIMEGRTQFKSSVYCASRDTLLAMLKSGVEMPLADLIIVDEAHVASTLVNDWYLKNCPNAYWTGFTASPIKPDGSSLAPPYQALVCMAPTSKMIELGRLCPVKVFNPDAVGQRRRRGEKVKPVGCPVDHWRKFANGLATVAYCSTVADSRKLVEKYLAAGIAAEHIDANTPEDEREAVFERSRLGQTKVISNCGVLIEGVDLPWLVCCQLLRGCNSLVLWIQATGRVMRVFPGKEYGIILDHSGAAHEFLLEPEAPFDYKWTLEDEDANKKKNALPKDKRAVTCPSCGAVFASKPACPECGKVLPRKMRPSAVESAANGDGVLTEFNGQQSEQQAMDKLVRLFKKAFYVARARGLTMGAAAAMFTKTAKVAPWKAGLPLNLPGPGEWQTPAGDWML